MGMKGKGIILIFKEIEVDCIVALVSQVRTVRSAQCAVCSVEGAACSMQGAACSV